MDSIDWMVLQTLYERQNITKASELLYMSQPALSYRIQQLEKEFGIVILERGRRGIEFTLQGEYLCKYAQEMLEELQSVKETLLSMDEQMFGILKIGATRSLVKNFLPKVFEEFNKLFPTVGFNIRTAHSGELVDMVEKRNIQIGFIRGNANWDGEKKLLMSEKICIVSNKEIHYSDLPGLPMISYNTETSLQKAISTWWKSMYRKAANTIMMVDNMEVAREMVRHGLGYAILPIKELIEEDGFFLLPLKTEHGENIVRESWMIYQEKSLSIPMVKAFIDHISAN